MTEDGDGVYGRIFSCPGVVLFDCGCSRLCFVYVAIIDASCAQRVLVLALTASRGVATYVLVLR